MKSTGTTLVPTSEWDLGIVINMKWLLYKLGGCPFNGPLSVMKYPTRESPRRDAASPIKYNGLRVPQPSSLSHGAQPVVPYRNIMDWPAPAVLVFNGCSLSVAACISTEKTQSRRNLTNIIPKNTKKSPIHDNMNAKITCDFGDDRCRIATARLKKDTFVKTRLHTARIVV